jgi:MATE family multidrug resistance protein
MQELAAVSLSNLTGNLTAISLVVGVLSAIETLAPQAFGCHRFSEIGLLCQRGILLCLLISPLAVGLWWNSGAILVAVGQSSEVWGGLHAKRSTHSRLSRLHHCHRRFCASIL